MRFRCYRVDCSDPVAQDLGESVYLDPYKAMATCIIAPFKIHIRYLKLNNECRKCVDLSVYIIRSYMQNHYNLATAFSWLSKHSNKTFSVFAVDCKIREVISV